MATKITDEEKVWLKTILDHFEKEDFDVRDRQIRTYRRLKLLWDGFARVWYSEVAHDWRIFDETQEQDNQQDYYNKPINVFRAYLESIIAALSITIPPIKCYPDDADNPLDILTAKAGDKIAELIDKHNDVSLLWLHALYTYVTEGMVACYNYTDEDEKYGTYDKQEYEDVEEENQVETDEYDPDGNPIYNTEKVIVTKFVGITKQPKSRQCMEVYGGLYVKIANYAKKQSDTPYLIFAYETNYVLARDRYSDIREKIQPGMGSPTEPYARWGRRNTQYQGEEPIDNVTVRNAWLRPASFEILEPEQCDQLKKKFKDGAKVVFIEQEFAEACNESLDDHWTLTHNPLTDYLNHDPVGLLLVSIQEITNDLISLRLQTIEHGIPQTFADPQVLNFNAYRQMETTPGAIYPATPKSGKSIGDGFYEVKVATLSPEVAPFANEIQQLGQLVSGATPSIFGGQLTSGSGTASEYSMSRAQALQRLQTTWKMFTVWWKNIHGKVIPAYIKNVQEDERIVQKDSFGNFVNILIRKSELEGKIGSVEIEANENLPMTWNQRRDVIMKLVEANNPQVLAMIGQPENLSLLYEALGINDFYIPGEDDRNKQYDEIKQLLSSEPIVQPPTDEEIVMAVESGMEPQETELPSVEVDVDFDNHAIQFEIVRKWAISEAGQQAKIDNPAGYKNVLLHGIQHKQFMMIPPEMSGQAPLANPETNTETPITEEKNVSSQV